MERGRLAPRELHMKVSAPLPPTRTIPSMESISDHTSPHRTASIRRLLPLGLLLAAWIVFMLAGGYRYVSLSALAENRDWLYALVQRWGAAAAFCYIVVY